MAIKQFSLQCAKCDAVMPHSQEAPNHLMHGLLTVFTGGLYLLAWLPIAAKQRKEATCTKCGNLRSVTGPATVSEARAIAKANTSLNRAQIAILAVAGVAVLAAVIYTAATDGL